VETVDAEFHGRAYGAERVELFGWASGGLGVIFVDHCYEFIAVDVGEFEAAVFHDETHVLTEALVNGEVWGQCTCRSG
jgi:hypothetical protein